MDKKRHYHVKHADLSRKKGEHKRAERKEKMREKKEQSCLRYTNQRIEKNLRG